MQQSVFHRKTTYQGNIIKSSSLFFCLVDFCAIFNENLRNVTDNGCNVFFMSFGNGWVGTGIKCDDAYTKSFMHFAIDICWDFKCIFSGLERWRSPVLLLVIVVQIVSCDQILPSI